MDKKVPSEFEMAYRARDSRARRRAWTQPGMWVERDRVRPLVDAWIARHDAVSELGGTSRAFSGLNRLAFEAGVAVRTIYRVRADTMQMSRRGGSILFNGCERFLSLDYVDRLFIAMGCEHLWHLDPSYPGASDGFSDVYEATGDAVAA